MKILRPLFCGALALALANVVLAESPATDAKPSTSESPKPKLPAPATPAPKQANAHSAPGAQSPNGMNGTTSSGKGVTKAPNSETRKPLKPANATASANPATPGTTPAGPAPKPAAPAQTVLDQYMQDLGDALKLTAEQKKEIQSYYLADAKPMQSILNDPASTPLQEAQQETDLRDARNAKIEGLLADVQQRHDFYVVEANYRVQLLEAAADGTLSGAPVQGAAGGGAVAPTITPSSPAAHGPAR